MNDAERKLAAVERTIADMMNEAERQTEGWHAIMREHEHGTQAYNHAERRQRMWASKLSTLDTLVGRTGLDVRS